MARFVVRNIEEEVKVRLQRRAKRNGRSMEAEVRDILRDAVKEEVFAGGLGTEITSLFSKIGFAEAEHIPELRSFKIRPPSFKR